LVLFSKNVQNVTKKKKTEQEMLEVSKLLVDPNWIQQKLFDDRNELVIKLLLIPVEPSVLARFAKYTGSSFGYLHTGLQINHTVVDWDSSGLIVPRQFSQNVYAALNIHTADTQKLKRTSELEQTVSKLIAKWNNDYEYNSFTKNCQHFVIAVIKAIGLDFRWNESIASYLDEIKNNPGNVTPHVNYKVNGKMVRKDFKTHQELDDFMEELAKSDPLQYSNLLGLLKAFDRGFWFRDLKNEEYKAPPNCPFKLPTGYEAEFGQLLGM